jgi:hypothetical protein
MIVVRDLLRACYRSVRQPCHSAQGSAFRRLAWRIDLIICETIGAAIIKKSQLERPGSPRGPCPAIPAPGSHADTLPSDTVGFEHHPASSFSSQTRSASMTETIDAVGTIRVIFSPALSNNF